MSAPMRSFAADAAHAGQMWQRAAATEHSTDRTEHTHGMLPERRIASDGRAYTYAEFMQWYGSHAKKVWERSAAEPLSSEGIRLQCYICHAPPERFCMRCERRVCRLHSIYQPRPMIPMVCVNCAGRAPIPRPGGNDGHDDDHDETCCSFQLCVIDDQDINDDEIPDGMSTCVNATCHDQCSSPVPMSIEEIASQARRLSLPALEAQTAVTELLANQADFVHAPRDATQLLPTSAQSSNTMFIQQHATDTSTFTATEHDTAIATATGLLQCIECERVLCNTEDLAFVWRCNKAECVEVYLMLKPENAVPATFIRSHLTEKQAMASWECECGFKLCNTRAVAVGKAAMTAFKSSSIMLCGERFLGQKSQWTSLYNQPPFNAIEVRSKDTFDGHHSINECHCYRAWQGTRF